MKANDSHGIHRVSHSIVRRRLQVARVVDITPRMRRVTLVGSELEGFVSAAPDDHIKLLFAANAEEQAQLDNFRPGSEGPKPTMRDYTPRRYDAALGELDIDFVLHGDGPASTWAAQAQVGQHLHVAGPRGSLIVPDTFDGYLLVGDETALPAIGRRLEGLAAGRRAVVLVEIEDDAERQPLSSAAELQVHWLRRGERTLVDALRELTLPEGEVFAWIACESGLSRQLRAVLLNEHGVSEDCMKAVGYWRQGAAQE
jgi:NADPH-dependent ferric siderophore reductase